MPRIGAGSPSAATSRRIPSRSVPGAATLVPMSAQPSMEAQPSVPAAATSLPEMSLPEWLVLAILSQQPAHGFAVAQLTAPGGDLGRVWQIPKAVVYRAIGRLLDAELIVPEVTEPGLGPQRTVYAATPGGQRGGAALAAHSGRARPGDPLPAAAQARPARPGRRGPGRPAARAARGPRADRRGDRGEPARAAPDSTRPCSPGAAPPRSPPWTSSTRSRPPKPG